MTSDPKDIEAHQGFPNLFPGAPDSRTDSWELGAGGGRGVASSHLLGALLVAVPVARGPPDLSQALPTLTHFPNTGLQRTQGQRPTRWGSWVGIIK